MLSQKLKVAFLFDRRPTYPPDFNNMKCYYVSEEIAKRGFGAIWLYLGSREQVHKAGAITFVSLKGPALRFFSTLFANLRILIFCISNSVRVIYLDAWFYFRDSPFRQLSTVLTLRIFGMRVVVDQRDPYLDFEVARGAVRPGTLRFKLLKIHEKITLYVCSLLVLPSKAYENLLIREGAPSSKVKGYFRGVDLKQFNSMVDGKRVRARLGLEGSFVVGWFGMMYRHRLVEEVLIPLAGNLDKIIPNSRMVVGGKGPLESAILGSKMRDGGSRLFYVGAIEYSGLPEYLSACDVLLCPVSRESRFSFNSNWLKIIEGIAVGVPVIATKTESSTTDLGELKGIVWTGDSLADFEGSIDSTYKNLAVVAKEAREQSKSLTRFGIDRTIPLIVDQVLQTGHETQHRHRHS
jgi:glycosyltransferase involved in cell wall biosynthesis